LPVLLIDDVAIDGATIAVAANDAVPVVAVATNDAVPVAAVATNDVVPIAAVVTNDDSVPIVAASSIVVDSNVATAGGPYTWNVLRPATSHCGWADAEVARCSRWPSFASRGVFFAFFSTKANEIAFAVVVAVTVALAESEREIQRPATVP
jgi:hypothetical protein